MLLLFILLLLDLVAVAYPLIAFFLFREWQRYRDTLQDDYADRCLYGAIALLALVLFGRFLIRMLVSKRRKGEDEPAMFETGRSETIRRPDGSRIHIEHFGRAGAPAIVFIHGWNANSRNWYYQRKAFLDDHHLIFMDLAGLGRSTRPSNKDFSLGKMADDLEAVLQHTGVIRPVLWGHSMGGMTILSLLAKWKASDLSAIRGVVLQNTTYTNPVKTMLFRKVMTALQKPVLTPLCYLMIALSPLLWVSRWMSYLNGNAHLMTRWLTFAGTQTPQQLEFSTLLSTMAPPAVMARGCLGMFQYDVTSRLQSMQVPVLIFTANKDRLTRPDAGAFMQEQLPDARLVRLEPANHQSLLERHQETNKAVRAFIRDLPKEVSNLPLA